MDALVGSRMVLHRGREAAEDLREQAELSREEAEKRVSTQAREQMIALAAYYRAQSRDFDPGHELEDWLEAEAEVNAQLEAR
jgi:DUF2934 family protein